MPKGINQKLKLLYIVRILERETDELHPMNAAALIDKLAAYNVSAERKSIYDDIAVLQDYGYDIMFNPSRRNGGYYMGSGRFELPELKILVDAVQASRFITPAKSRDLINKLEQLSNKYDENELKRQIYVLNRIKSDNECIYYVVNDIYHAIQSNKQIEFTYLVWNFEKVKVPKKGSYVVSPWTLVFDNSNYYLIAYDDNAGIIKHYRVDKIKDVRELDSDRMGNEEYEKFDVVSYLNRTFNMYGGEEESITLRISDSLIGVFIDRFGDGISAIVKEPGTIDVRINVAVSGQFFGWLSGLGSGMRIMSPDHIREKYVAYLSEIIKAQNID
jgi:predicted DNA-binding transcriptional regulator YafY